jgi:hypothetical protein
LEEIVKAASSLILSLRCWKQNLFSWQSPQPTKGPVNEFAAHGFVYHLSGGSSVYVILKELKDPKCENNPRPHHNPKLGDMTKSAIIDSSFRSPCRAPFDFTQDGAGQAG